MTETVRDAHAAEQEQRTPGKMLATYRDDFATVLPSHLADRADAFVRVAQGVLARNEKLREVAIANPYSFLAAARECAELGLRPGDTYHFVPFGKEVVGITDYTGLEELIYRAGAASSVRFSIVRENDEFEYEPTWAGPPKHKVDYFGSDRGAMIGAYAYAVMKDGATSQVVVMNRAEIEHVRNQSPLWSRASEAKRAQSPWTLWTDRMWLKTVIRQLAKHVPTSTEYLTAQLAAVAKAHGAPPSQPMDAPEVTAVQMVDPETGEVLDAEIVEPAKATEDPPDNPGFGSDQT